MSFDFGPRAFILCFAFFFLLHAALGLVVSAASRLTIFESIRPRAAARLLLTFRLLPVSAAIALTCMLVPAYFQWERQKGSEAIGLFAILSASAGVAVWIQSFVRSVRAILTSRATQQVIESHEPFLALAGIFRPRIIISRGFLETIPADQREIAIRHEMAHFRSADNLKRLLMLLAPPVAPCCDCVYAPLEGAWARYAERAADDYAVEDDPGRASLLAEVLVNVARGQSLQRPLLASTLVGSRQELCFPCGTSHCTETDCTTV